MHHVLDQRDDPVVAVAEAGGALAFAGHRLRGGVTVTVRVPNDDPNPGGGQGQINSADPAHHGDVTDSSQVTSAAASRSPKLLATACIPSASTRTKYQARLSGSRMIRSSVSPAVKLHSVGWAVIGPPRYAEHRRTGHSGRVAHTGSAGAASRVHRGQLELPSGEARFELIRPDALALGPLVGRAQLSHRGGQRGGGDEVFSRGADHRLPESIPPLVALPGGFGGQCRGFEIDPVQPRVSAAGRYMENYRPVLPRRFV